MICTTSCSEYGFPGTDGDEETENNDTTVKESERRSPLSVVYIETKNSLLTNVDCIRMEDGSPAFDIAIIFAGNINMDANGKAEVRLNPGVTDLLKNKIAHVKQLQGAGTKVLLSILGNHDEAGWSCFESYDDAKAYAVRVREVVEKYGLDGPGSEIVTRDRAGSYAAAIKACAPQALQVADRFHLLQNLSDALDTYFKSISKEIKVIITHH